jgi:tRNA-dihydrouridine synthase B
MRRDLAIGPLRLSTPVLSAPIAGFTDRIFRGIVREFGGCGLIFTEMISAGGWIEEKYPPDRLRGVDGEPRPLGVQLWDREESAIEEASRRLADLGVSVIDLNFGCPKKRIMGTHGAGATLLRDPATVGRLVAAAVRGAGSIPVTAKMRLGPSVACRTAPAVARSAEANGAAAITVHGRTADDGYGIPCSHELIAEVVQAVSVPVIANGDVVDAQSALATLRLTGAAGVMVARGALTRPWVFREIAAALRGDPLPASPTLLEQRALLLRHHAAMVEQEGDHWGTVAMRKCAVRYLTGIPGARPFRDRITRAENSAEFRATVDAFFPTEEMPAGAASPVEAACASA